MSENGNVSCTMRSRYIVLGLLVALAALFCLALMAEPGEGALVAEWHMDEGAGQTVVDTSGNGNNGTLMPTYPTNNATWTSGISGNALNFDGVDDYVEVNSSDTLNFTSGNSISISTWIYPNSVLGQWVILTKGGSGLGSNNINYQIRIDNGEFYFFYRSQVTPSWQTFSSNTPVFEAGSWYYVAVTYTFGTGNSIKLYVNGQEAPGAWTGAGNEAPVVSNEPIWIGKQAGPGGGDNDPFNGTIDEVRIWNQTLTPGEISDYFNSTRPPVYNVDRNTAYFTIQAAIDAANPSDTLNIDPGTYAESLNIDKVITFADSDFTLNGNIVVTGTGALTLDNITLDCGVVSVASGGLWKVINSPDSVYTTDQYIEGTASWDDSSVYLVGADLYVGGFLWANNTLVQFNVTDNTHYIQVNASGEMFTDAGTSFGVNDTGRTYGFTVFGTLGMNDSTVQNVGTLEFETGSAGFVNNSAINANGAAIRLDTVTGITVHDNAVTSATSNGIHLQGGNNNIITGNNASDNGNAGIYLQTSTYNTVSDNTLNDNPYGLYLFSSSNSNDVMGNNGSGNIYGFYLSICRYNEVVGNNFSGNTQDGIWLFSSYFNNLTDNTLDDNSKGMRLRGSDYNNVSYNDASGNTQGFYVETGSEWNNLTGNNATGNTYGVYMDDSDRNDLTGTNASGNILYGIHLFISHLNNLTDSKVNNNPNRGIYLQSSNGNNLTGNEFNGNGQYGLYFSNSRNTNVTGNTVDGNNRGIDMVSMSHWNYLTDNQFINNGQYGIRIDASSDIILENNTATCTGINDYAVYLWNNAGATSANGTYSSTASWDVYLSTSSLVSTDDTFGDLYATGSGLTLQDTADRSISDAWQFVSASTFDSQVDVRVTASGSLYLTDSTFTCPGLFVDDGGSLGVDPTYVYADDVFINGTADWSDSFVYLQGNLTIGSTGILWANNTLVQFNVTDNTHYVQVNASGEMWLENSTLQDNTTSYRFQVQVYGAFGMNDSSLLGYEYVRFHPGSGTSSYIENSITQAQGFGIWVQQDIRVRWNDIISPGGTSLAIQVTAGGSGANVSWNDITAGWEGLKIDGADNVQAWHNNISSTQASGAGLLKIQNGNGNVLAYNTVNVSGDNSEGMIISQATGNTIMNNTIITDGSQAYGIYVLGNVANPCQFNEITGNDITTNGGTSYAIYLGSDAPGNNLTRNNINTTGSSSHAIYSTGNGGLRVENNTVVTMGLSSWGVYCEGPASGADLWYNDIDIYGDSSRGISVLDTDTVNVNNNTIYIWTTGTSNKGIAVQASATAVFDVEIRGNFVRTYGSQGTGIQVTGNNFANRVYSTAVSENDVVTDGANADAIYVATFVYWANLVDNTATALSNSRDGLRVAGAFAHGSGNTFSGDGQDIYLMASAAYNSTDDTFVNVRADTGSAFRVQGTAAQVAGTWTIDGSYFGAEAPLHVAGSGTLDLNTATVYTGLFVVDAGGHVASASSAIFLGDNTYVEGYLHLNGGGFVKVDTSVDREFVLQVNASGTMNVTSETITRNTTFSYDFDVYGALNMDGATISEGYALYVDTTNAISIVNSRIHNMTDYGIISDSASFSVSGTAIENCTQDGVNFDNGALVLNLCTLKDNGYGVMAFDEVLLDNCTLNNTMDIGTNSWANVTALNTSFNKTRAQFFDAWSNLTVQWYVHVYANDTSGAPVPGAMVWVNDTFGSNENVGTTDAAGMVWWLPTTEYVQNSTTQTDHTPHDIEANTATKIGNETATINGTTTVSVTLIDKNAYNIDQGTWHETITGAVAAANPGDHIMVNNGTYDETLVINKRLTLMGWDPATTIINGTGAGTVVNITSDWVNLTGFTILNSGTLDIPAADSCVQLFWVQNCRVEDVNASNGGFGISLYDASNNYVANNTCMYNARMGILLWYSDNNVIYNNTCTYNDISAMMVSMSNGNSIESNNCSRTVSWYGLYLTSANNCYVANNTCSYNPAYGLYVSGSEWNTFAMNDIFSNGNHGMLISGSGLYYGNNTINNNTIWGNTGRGIELRMTQDNRVWNNTLTGNADYGLYVWQAGTARNLVYNNNLVNNNGGGTQAYDDLGTNTWYAPYPQGGNHYSVWTAPDVNADGFVDNAYALDGGAGVQDAWPHTVADGWLNAHPAQNVLNIDQGLWYEKIQKAVNSAGTGDTIWLPVGTYLDNVKLNHTVNLVGEDMNATIIDGGGSGDVLNVTADNVTVSSLTIVNSGSGGNDAGVRVLGARDCVIFDNNVSGNRYSIVLQGADSNVVDNNTLWGSTYGLLALDAHYNTVSNNTAWDNTDGLRLAEGSSMNIFEWNDVSGNDYGIWITAADNNTIEWNTANGNTWVGVYLITGAVDNLVLNNTAGANAFGITVDTGCNGNLVRDNTLAGNGQYGILLQNDADWNEVANNTITGSTDGIRLMAGSDNNTISDNDVSGAGDNGIAMLNSFDNTVAGNDAYGNLKGIFISYSDRTNVSGNWLNANTESGIHIERSNWTEVWNNNATDTNTDGTYAGIFLYYSYNATVGGNTADDQLYGIRLQYSGWSDVLGNTARNNSNYNVQLYYSDYCFADGNTVEDGPINGFRICYSEGCEVAGLTANNNEFGFYLCSSDNTLLRDSTLTGNTRGVHADANPLTTNWVENCTIAGSTLYDFELSMLSVLEVVNTSFDRAKVEVTDAQSKLSVRWYLQAYVNDTLGNPLAGVDVQAADNANGSWDEWRITGADGRIWWWELIEFNHTSTGAVNYTPFTVFATNDTHYNTTTVDLTSSQSVTLTLDVAYPVQNLDLVKGYFTITEALASAAPGHTITAAAGTYNENLDVTFPVSLVGDGSGTTTINGAGSYNVVNITANNVILEGFTVVGSGFSGTDTGVLLSGVQGCVLTDIDASSNNYGFYLDASGNNTFEGCAANGTPMDGLFMDSSHDNYVGNGTFSGNGVDGISLLDSNRNTIARCEANSNAFAGIYLETSSNNTIHNNTCAFNSHGIDLWSYSHDNVVEYNDCNNHSGTGNGIRLYNANRTEVGNNDLFDNGRGIRLRFSSDCQVHNNTCWWNDYGIYLSDSSDDGMLKQNDLQANDVSGLFADGCTGLTLAGNFVLSGSSGAYGLHLANGTEADSMGSVYLSNLGWGVFVDGSTLSTAGDTVDDVFTVGAVLKLDPGAVTLIDGQWNITGSSYLHGGMGIVVDVGGNLTLVNSTFYAGTIVVENGSGLRSDPSTIYLEGNLYVNGTLDLTAGDELRVNCTVNREYTIQVNATGTMNITDALVTSNNTFAYDFDVYGTLNMEGAEISLGYALFIDGTDDVHVNGSYVHNMTDYGILSTGCNLSVSNTTIENCGVTGMDHDQGELELDNCTIRYNGGGVLLGIGSQNATIWNSDAVDNNGDGIRSVHGFWLTLTDCVLANNTGDGLEVDTSLDVQTSLSGCTVRDNGAAGAALTGSGAKEFVGFQCVISNNVIGLSAENTAIAGLIRCDLDDNTDAAIFSRNSTVSVVNCTMTGNTLEANLTDVGVIGFLNTTADGVDSNFGDAGSTLIVSWYLHVLVENGSGNPVIGANVTVMDNASFADYYVTDAAGMVRWAIVNEYVETQASLTHYTPHNVSAWLPGMDMDWTSEWINASTWVFLNVTDNTPPTTAFSLTGTQHGTAPVYVSGSTQVNLTGMDTGTGINGTWYSFDNTSWTLYAGPFSLSAPGAQTLYYNSTDNAGNHEATHEVDLFLDDAAPTTTLAPGTPYHMDDDSVNWSTTATVFSLTAADAGSGVNATWYRIDGVFSPGTSFTLTPGTHMVAWGSLDNVTNNETGNSRLITVEEAAPTTTLTPEGPFYVNGSGANWASNATLFNLSAVDGGSGVNGTWFLIDGTEFQWNTSFTLSAGNHNVSYGSIDNLGNNETGKYVNVTIDDAAPVSVLNVTGPFYDGGSTQWVSNATLFNVSAVDAGCGVATIWYAINGTYNTTSTWFNLSHGQWNVTWGAVDHLGNNGTGNSMNVTVDTAPPLTVFGNSQPFVYNATSGVNWLNTSTTLYLNATDAGSGVDHTWYSIGSNHYWGTSFTLPPGVHVITYGSVDALGNNESAQTIMLSVEEGAPTATLTPGAPSYNASGTWWGTTNTWFQLGGTDAGSDVADRWFADNSGARQYPAGGRFQLTAGWHNVTYGSIDWLGHESLEGNVTVVVENDDPTTMLTIPATTSIDGLGNVWVNDTGAFTITADDGMGVGIDFAWYVIDGAYSTGTGFTLSEGTHDVMWGSRDLLWHNDTNGPTTYRVDGTAPTTSLVITGPNVTTANGLVINASTRFQIFFADAGIGTGLLAYSIDDWASDTVDPSPSSSIFKINATVTLRYFGVDEVENWEAQHSLDVIYDPTDTDGDGIDDLLDDDDDNDGTSDATDTYPKDTDDDGTPNAQDDDDDGDGLPDTNETAEGTDPLDPDTDGDGAVDGDDAFPLNGNETTDTDGDGIGDNADDDDDNDGILDDDEVAAGLDPKDPTDATEDDDGDGLSNRDELIAGTDLGNSDSDNDGYTDKEELDAGTDPLDAADFPAEAASWFPILLILVIAILIILLVLVSRRKRQPAGPEVEVMEGEEEEVPVGRAAPGAEAELAEGITIESVEEEVPMGKPAGDELDVQSDELEDETAAGEEGLAEEVEEETDAEEEAGADDDVIEGDVAQCPTCGAVIAMDAPVCPKCGEEFEE